MQGVRAIKLARLFTHAAPKRNYTGHGKVTTLDDLPTPQGSWQTHYDAQQRKYNGHLFFGIAFTVGTVIFAMATGCLDLNYNPPLKPAPPTTY